MNKQHIVAFFVSIMVMSLLLCIGYAAIVDDVAIAGEVEVEALFHDVYKILLITFLIRKVMPRGERD